MGRIKKKVVVAGGSGFIGSHIADELTSRGYDVTIYDKNSSQYINKHQKMVIGNILDYESVDEVTMGKDIVYNYAAQANIDSVTPVSKIENNILGNTIILEACRQNKVKRFVFASSIYVYSNMGSFYRSTKQACESIIRDYNEEFGLNYTTLRYSSVYGPRANKFNWIHKIIKEALESGKITRYGDGEEIREYLHVKDAAKLSVDILDKKYENKHIMITGNQSMRIKDVHMMISEILGGDIDLIYIESETPKNHFIMTPYSFSPKSSERLTSNLYHDIGQGILECIKEIYTDEN